MKKAKSGIILNYIYNCAYQLLKILLPLVTAPYISRVLGAENIGIYSYTHANANYFVLLAALGITNYGSRSCARVRDNRSKLSRTFCGIFYIQCVSSALSIAAFTVFAMLSDRFRSVYFLWEFYVVSALFDISWLFFSKEEFKITVMRNIVVKLLSVACTFLFVKEKSDFNKYIFILSFSFLVTQLSVWPFVRRYIDWVRVPPRELIAHIKPILRLFIPVIAVSIYNIMDKIMLGRMCDMTQSGFYENTEKLLTIPTSLIIALGTVMLPRMSYLAAEGKKDESDALMRRSMLFVSFLSCALAFGISGISPEFVPYFFGTEFAACTLLVIALSPKILCVSWANVIRTQFLLPQNRDRDYIISVSAGAVVNLIFNLILIPKMEALGAIIATVLAEITVAVIQTYSVREAIPWKDYLTDGVPFVVFGTIMLAVTRVFCNIASSVFLSLIIQIIIGAAVYLILVVAYVALFKKDIALLIKLKIHKHKCHSNGRKKPHDK